MKMITVNHFEYSSIAVFKRLSLPAFTAVIDARHFWSCSIARFTFYVLPDASVKVFRSSRKTV